MILPDVNILVNAFRKDASEHQRCRTWLDRTILGDSRFGVSPLVLSAAMRITTNPRTFRPASTIDDVVGFCNDILNQPHCQVVEPGERHWSIFTKLCADTKTTGPMISDLWHAALAIEWGCEWITLDRDYARIPGLKSRQP
jgi:toxin-antitoxin system PIN domain toxin